MSFCDWVLNRSPHNYYLCKAVIKRVNLNKEGEPHTFTEELRLIKARNIEEADAIFEHHVQRRQTSWCAYFVESSSFEVALSN
jgi:hypothetical protein